MNELMRLRRRALMMAGNQGGKQGLVDINFNYTDGTYSWSGVVENNILRNFSASTYCSAPLWLKQPVAIATNDVLTMTVSGLVYADAGIINPFIYFAGRNLGVVKILDNGYPGTYRMTYTGYPFITNRLFYYTRTSPVSNATCEIHFKVNDTVIL